MYIVSTFLGGLSGLECEFYDKTQAVNYKNLLINLYDFDPEYITIDYMEV